MSTNGPAILVFDASTEVVNIGLTARGKVFSRTMAGGAESSRTLLPGIETLLEDAGLTLSALDAIGFGAGPGSFTGVRSATAVAQALSFASGRALIQIGSLDALAHSDESDARWIVAALDARMSEVYYALYRRDAGVLINQIAPSVATPQAAREQLDAVTSSSWRAVGAALLLRGTAVDTDNPKTLAADMLIERALDAYARGALIDAANAQPLYVRDKVALTTTEREALRATTP
ncbi:MAG TPA: tRNA (adenosine(37)-N6)-threonylcarbamoyltransferase complex dimerization subunit type 1 TsaB [Burkholderiaceae bacterium]|nr:tRNA (adenosine(37)-N6)-threonylcarbamoyltransferase complex dimerization subunit type 1 TsaB [Burkholderiaceae bacterium]